VTWFLIGAAIGLLAAIAIGLWRTPRIYNRQLAQYEADIPRWVNQGNRAVIGTYDEILDTIRDAINFDLWEYEMEQVDE
jgi:hypothetical protein